MNLEKGLTPEELGALSDKVEHFIMLEIGVRLPYVGLLFDPRSASHGLALFTNRKLDDEVRLMLEEALRGLVKPGARFKVMDGEVEAE